MADQSAIKIPQGQLPINLVDDLTILHCSPNGSDDTGDGSITNPYYNPNRAFADFSRMFFTESGHGRIQCARGTYTFGSPIHVRNKDKKRIDLIGEQSLPFVLQQVTSYKYDAVENKTANGFGVGSLVDNRITIKVASKESLVPLPSSPVAPSVSGIEVGDYILLRDEINTTNTYNPSGRQEGYSYGEGLTGGNTDSRTNTLGCFEIINVNSVDNTLTFRSRGKNFLHKLGKSKVTDGGDLTVGDDIYVGSYPNDSVENTYEDASPVGKYGSLSLSGIDTTDGVEIISNHKISATIVKTVFDFKRPDTGSRANVVKGLVVSDNSTLDRMADIVLQGDVRFKHFNEINPASSNGEGILVYKNALFGSRDSSNIGLSGWYAGIVSHSNSFVELNRVAISDCSFGLVAQDNSTLISNNSTLTGCDIIGAIANNNSSLQVGNSLIASAGYSQYVIDLKNVGSDVAELDTGKTLLLPLGDGSFVKTSCVWNSFKDPYNLMRDPIRDTFNYYPLNTGNQVYLKAMFPTSSGENLPLRDELTNEVPPYGIIFVDGSGSMSVGNGVLPETVTPREYVPNQACGTSEEDISGGVCYPPGFFSNTSPWDEFNSTGGEESGGEQSFNDDSFPCPAFNLCCCYEEFVPGQGSCANGTFCGDEANTPQFCAADDQNAACGCDSLTCGQQCDLNCPDIPAECNNCGICDGCNCGPSQGECCVSGPPCCDGNSPIFDECNPGCYSDGVIPCTCGDRCQDADCTGDPCCNTNCVDGAGNDSCNNGDSCCCDVNGGVGGLPCFCDNPSSCIDFGTDCDGLPGQKLECDFCPPGGPRANLCPCPGDTEFAGLCVAQCDSDPPEPEDTTYTFIDHPYGIGIMAYNNSSVNSERSFITLMRNVGAYAMENSSVDADYTFVRSCSGAGFYSRANSNINAKNTACIRTSGGYYAKQNSNIQANFAYARDNSEYNFFSIQDSIINCENAISVISRTLTPGSSNTITITTTPTIYAGMSVAHGSVKLGSFINKVGITELESGEVVPNSGDSWTVDSSSHINPSSGVN